jgi:hypothetical protein
MSDAWEWWRRQLAHQQDPSLEKPECTPGTPYTGFYLHRRRWTRPNDDPNRRPGDPRHKVTTEYVPVAIWEDSGWHMVIGKEEYYRDPDKVDDVFSRCCRSAITHDEYERIRNEAPNE